MENLNIPDVITKQNSEQRVFKIINVFVNIIFFKLEKTKLVTVICIKNLIQ